MPDDPPPIDPQAPYLLPYTRAAARTRGKFESLLWASPDTQRARFDALCRIVNMNGARVLDVGCGRADLLGHFVRRNVHPAEYVGVEAVPELVAAAREAASRSPVARIVQADFVTEADRQFAGAEVIVMSGSLNTVPPETFYKVLRAAHAAASRCVAFNFLCSSSLAAADYLYWHRTDEVMAFARSLTPIVHKLEDYLDGDCTIMMGKP
ncbi:MAG: methyltransferase domain-containing protein [Phycisphaerae bacterium]|nr:class I SAM-dependent methyltransferase [Tepidisphaeraceae bacterium]